MKYSNNEKYNGEWDNDMKSGKGTYTYTNGNEYYGDWRNDKKNGKGIFHLLH